MKTQCSPIIPSILPKRFRTPYTLNSPLQRMPSDIYEVLSRYLY